MPEKLKTEKKQNGGARPGSGRKPKLKDDARQAFYAAVDERWAQIMAGLDKWIKKGDKHVLLAIVEQRIGKAPQTMKVGGDPDNKTAIPVRWLDK